jgi:hypothetical protein
LTVIASVAVRIPFVVSTAVTVIVVEPALTAVTRPLLFTVATDVLLEDQATLGVVA